MSSISVINVGKFFDGIAFGMPAPMVPTLKIPDPTSVGEAMELCETKPFHEDPRGVRDFVGFAMQHESAFHGRISTHWGQAAGWV